MERGFGLRRIVRGGSGSHSLNWGKSRQPLETADQIGVGRRQPVGRIAGAANFLVFRQEVRAGEPAAPF